MLTNTEMKANRFLNWQTNRKMVAWIEARLTEGRTVCLTTYTKQTRYTKRHLGMFKAARTGAYVQHGKQWLCINGCKITTT